MGRPRLPLEVEYRFWAEIRAGLSQLEAADVIGVSGPTANRWFRQRGGVMPPTSTCTRSRVLSFAEREQIGLLRAAGHGVRAIARELDRDPGTISRELRRVRLPKGHSVRTDYLASVAQSDADVKARRPKTAKLSTNLPLRREVQDRLLKHHSPEQIARRLREEFPDDPEMWVSHETIYQSLYVQSRGGLKRELTRHLRTGRSMRKPHRKTDERRGRIPGMVMISERPPEVEDRAVPGHWEGDLILGSQESGSAVGTLVERATRYVLLLHLPGPHTAEAVAEAMVEKMGALPDELRQSL